METEDFPRAICHGDELQDLIGKREAKHSTPVRDIETQEFMLHVNFNKQNFECDYCSAA